MLGSEATSESTTSLTGRVVLGRYRIVRPLARGGMGVVYLGRVEGAAGFSKAVVVKSVLSSFGREDEAERLFAREARIVSNLNHPGVVAVIDFGKVGDACVMVLEYVHGYHLLQWLRFVNERRGLMPVQHAVHVVLTLLETLDHAHRLKGPDGAPLGIVHRDISPANVLIDQAGHIKLSDFGIARMSDDEAKTQEGLFRGTLPFAAPETLHGPSSSPKVDQYGCAVILYMLLAGKNPFKGGEPHETMTRVLTLDPPPVSKLRRDVPAAIDAAILRALSKDPEARFDSVAEFAEAIRAGITWSEREAAERFEEQIAKDFGGTEMPEQLGIESLAARDSSWRDAQDVAPTRVSLSSSPPGIQRGVREQPTPGLYPTKNVGPPSSDQKTARPPSSRLGLWIVLAALAAGAGSAAVIVMMQRREPEHAARVLVIEKQEGVRAEPTASPEVAPAPVATSEPVPAPSEGARAASASSKARTGSPPSPENKGALLARAFQRQEGKIQSCFTQHSATGGEPPITVRFQIDASGAVNKALVSPASVASTPLGQCVAGVAASTKFDPQPEPVSFSIPIASRVVRR